MQRGRARAGDAKERESRRECQWEYRRIEQRVYIHLWMECPTQLLAFILECLSPGAFRGCFCHFALLFQRFGQL